METEFRCFGATTKILYSHIDKCANVCEKKKSGKNDYNTHFIIYCVNNKCLLYT